MKNILKVLPLLIFVACSSSTEYLKVDPKMFYEIPKDWEDSLSRQAVIDNYSEFLNGHKFFIDPGHGGEDRKNKSQDGKLVEADLNLKVALALKDYLEQAGAVVFMSRDKDTTVDLKERSIMANNSGAEFFISIHHNSPGSVENTWTNYTATFYHATEDDYEYEPFNHDFAKYVQRDLSYVMRTSGGLGSFDGTYSDYKIYPGDGFSVLRETQLPAILIEAAFFTSEFEKYRLAEEEFNKIQAWGIFRGIGKLFQAGIPEVTLLKDKCELKPEGLHLVLKLEDESGIRAESIRTYFDKVPVNHNFSENDNTLTIDIKDIQPGEHILRVICENHNGIHSLPYYSKIITE